MYPYEKNSIRTVNRSEKAWIPLGRVHFFILNSKQKVYPCEKNNQKEWKTYIFLGRVHSFCFFFFRVQFGSVFFHCFFQVWFWSFFSLFFSGYSSGHFFLQIIFLINYSMFPRGWLKIYIYMYIRKCIYINILYIYTDMSQGQNGWRPL